MSMWFSGTAVMPQLASLWHAGYDVTAWLTLAVQLGFVTGALVSSVFTLPDVFHAPRFIAFCMVLGAVCNAGFAFAADKNIALALFLRCLTGAALAGVYPPGMKVLAGWFREGRGSALGWMVGALAFGSAMPHAVNAFGAIHSDNWRNVVLFCSGQALVAAFLVWMFVHDGPFAAPSQPFDLSQATQVFRNRTVRLANFGYFGHMWELYSLWSWAAVLLAAATAGGSAPMPPTALRMAAFTVIASGFIGCVWAGRVSDQASHEDANARIAQRAKVTIWSMAVSGTCCLLMALAFGRTLLVLLISLVWGIAVVADSAQFSAIVSEASDARYVGTALTLQTALGFLLTVISIRFTSWFAAHYGWNWAAASLAIGPVLGVWAMLGLGRKSANGSVKTR